jgi:hypothetical protein
MTKTNYQFNKDVVRRVDLAYAMIDDITRLANKGGCTRGYREKIITRALHALRDADFLDPAMLQGEISKHAIHELKDKLKTPTQAAKELKADIRRTRYAIKNVKGR